MAAMTNLATSSMLASTSFAMDSKAKSKTEKGEHERCADGSCADKSKSEKGEKAKCADGSCADATKDKKAEKGDKAKCADGSCGSK